jgi:hypothetical protein
MQYLQTAQIAAAIKMSQSNPWLDKMSRSVKSVSHILISLMALICLQFLLSDRTTAAIVDSVCRDSAQKCNKLRHTKHRSISIEVAQEVLPSCTLKASRWSLSSGTHFMISWTIRGGTIPSAAAYLTVNSESYITDGSGGVVWAMLAGRELLQGTREIKVGRAGTYTYELIVGPAPIAKCFVTINVTGTASLPRLPSVTSRIGLAGIFYRPTSAAAYGKMPLDVIWSSTDPVRASVASMYNNSFNEEPYHASHGRFGAPPDHDRAWFEANHPDWLAYKEDKALAVWPGHRADVLMPLDFANPDVQDYVWSRRTNSIIANGYAGISYDNVTSLNFEHRWGINRQGVWVKKYSGIFRGGNPLDATRGDPLYARAVKSWLSATVARVHAAGALLFANIPYEYGGEGWIKAMADVLSTNDVLLTEQAFSRGACAAPDRQSLDENWLARYQTFSYIAKHHGFILAQGCFGSTPRLKEVSASFMNWMVANYLLVREAHTYLGFMSADESHDKYDRPELRVSIGAPAGPAKQVGKLWVRQYQNGWAVVNPTSSQEGTLRLGAERYFDLEGARIEGMINVPPATGLIIVRNCSGCGGQSSH